MEGFDWDDANINHIREHDVEPEEAEEALDIDPLSLASEIVDGERLFEVVGRTAAGRILKVIWVDRDFQIRVVTAFDATAHLKRIYSRRTVRP